MPVTELFFPVDDLQSEIAQESESDAARDYNRASPPRSRRTWMAFDRAFPSIIKTAIRLRDARNSNSLCAVRSLTDVFLTCSRTTVHEIHSFFPDSHDDPSYKLSKSATEFLISLLHGAKMQAQDTDIDTMLDLADMVLTNLKELTRVALRVTRERKPLPAVPSNINVSKPQTQSSTPRSEDASVVVRLSIFDYELVESDVNEESYRLQGLKKLLSNKKLRNLFKLHRTFPAGCPEYFISSTTLVDDDSSTTATVAPKVKQCEKKFSDVPYGLRQSTFVAPSNETSSKHDLIPLQGTNLTDEFTGRCS